MSLFKLAQCIPLELIDEVYRGLQFSSVFHLKVEIADTRSNVYNPIILNYIDEIP